MEPFGFFTALMALAIASSGCANAEPAGSPCPSAAVPAPKVATAPVQPAAPAPCSVQAGAQGTNPCSQMPHAASPTTAGSCAGTPTVVMAHQGCGACVSCSACPTESRYALAVTRPGVCNDFPVTYRVQVPDTDPRVRSVERLTYR